MPYLILHRAQAASAKLLCALVVILAGACTSYGPPLPSPTSAPGELVQYPVHEGDKVRITLLYPGPLPSQAAASPDEDLAPGGSPGLAMALGPETGTQGGGEGTSSSAGREGGVPDEVLSGDAARQCCHEFEVLQVDADGLHGARQFVAWNDIDIIQVAEPDHLKTVALVATFPLWFPVAVLIFALAISNAMY